MIRIDSKAFVKSMMTARKTLSRLVIKAVKRVAQLAADHAKATSLFKDRTGQLRSNIKPSSVSAFHSKVTANRPYSAWVENGNGFRSGAQFIYPKKAKFLRWEVDGKVHFARRVRTSKPRPFMAEAEKHTTTLFEQLCVDAVNGMFG